MSNTPKYMKIVEWTIKQITTRMFLPKDKFLSEAALSEKFGFSRQTVRRALEVLEEQGYITRIHGSGTYISPGKNQTVQPADKPGKNLKTVGIISTYLDDYIFPNIIRGLESVFTTNGYAIMLASTNNLVSGETRALQLMEERQLDGLIIEPTRSALPCANLDLYHTITKQGLPLVFIDSFYPELSIPYIALDDVKAGYIATQYLLSMGHRNIFGVFPHSHRQGHLRYLGYVKALNEQGISVIDDNICWYSKATNLQLIHSKQVLDLLPECTAVLCFNDWTALMIMDLLRENGRSVPEDLSVMGIDNSKLAKISSLTSIIHPAQQLGEDAAKMIISMINGSEGKSILYPPQLIERKSVLKLNIENGQR